MSAFKIPINVDLRSSVANLKAAAAAMGGFETGATGTPASSIMLADYAEIEPPIGDKTFERMARQQGIPSHLVTTPYRRIKYTYLDKPFERASFRAEDGREHPDAKTYRVDLASYATSMLPYARFFVAPRLFRKDGNGDWIETRFVVADSMERLPGYGGTYRVTYIGVSSALDPETALYLLFRCIWHEIERECAAQGRPTMEDVSASLVAVQDLGMRDSYKEEPRRRMAAFVDTVRAWLHDDSTMGGEQAFHTRLFQDIILGIFGGKLHALRNAAA